MRKLAVFSFAFAAGALLWLAGLPRLWKIGAAAVLFALFCAAFWKRRGRRERLAAILLAGALCGFGWSAAYRVWILAPKEALAGQSGTMSVELRTWPRETAYGSAAEGDLLLDGRCIRVQLYAGVTDGWKPGDVLTGRGTLSLPDGNYGRSAGLPLRLSLRGNAEVVRAEKIAVRDWPAALAHRVQEAAAALFPADVWGYFLALLTGDHSGLDEVGKSQLQIAGIYHTMAVSGMHVAIFMSLLNLVTLHNRRLYTVLGIPLLCFYCLMVGGAPSVVRAAVMQAFLMAAPVFRRESDTPTSLGAALLVLTAFNPFCLLNVGLQLSFGSTAGIVGFSPRFYRAMTAKPGRLPRLRRAAAGILAATFGALLPTVPLMAVYFGTVSLLSPLTNVLTLWAVTASFSLGIFASALFFLSPAAAVLAAKPAVLLMRYVAFAAGKIAGLPFAAVYPNTPYLVFWLAFSYLLLLLLLLWRKPGRAALTAGGSCAALLLCVCLWLSWHDGRNESFSFSALEVGEGQCLLLQSGGETAAIDCGSHDGAAAGETLAETLLSSGCSRLDYLVLTHYDADHVDGVPLLLSRISVDRLILPDCVEEDGIRAGLETMAAAAGASVEYAAEDRTLPFGTGSVSVFAPVSGSGGNASGLSVLASFGDYDILVTGDLPQAQEETLLRTHALPDLELLVAGHHGSRTSTGAALLAAGKPETVVISVGPNSYGHPAAETIERITAAGAAVLRTDELGDITIRR